MTVEIDPPKNSAGEYSEIHDPLARFFLYRLKLDWMKLWFISILYFGIFEKIILPIVGGFINFSGPIQEWVPHVEALLTGFIEFPIFMAFYLWSGDGVIALFKSMRIHQNFQPVEKYDAFVNKALGSFRKKRWIVLSIAFAILTVFVMNFVIWEQQPDAMWFGDTKLTWLMQPLALFNIGLVTYTVAQSIIREMLVIVWLRRLWEEMGVQLDVHQYHEDGAGGLGGIGHHTVIYLFFVAVLMLFILMATIFPSFISTTEDQNFTIRLWSPVLVVIWASYLVFIPTMLFLLIWPVHTIMVKKRDERLAGVSSKLDEKLDLATKYAVSDPTKAAEILKEMNDMKSIRAVILDDFPIWPITKESKGLLGLTSMVPTLYSAITFVVGVLS